MIGQNSPPGFWRARLVGAVLVSLLGLAILLLPVGRGLRNLSYDYGFLFKTDIPVEEALILYMDERSEAQLGQGRWDRWDRSVHADLLRRLAESPFQPRAVIFDVLFWPPGANVRADQELVRAAQEFGPVAVAAKVAPQMHQAEIIGRTVVRPFPDLAETTLWGAVEVADEDRAIREHFQELEFGIPSLAWRAAELAVGHQLENSSQRRWVHYYGPPGWIPYISYGDLMATNFTAWATLSNKVVFVGGLWSLGFTGGKGTDDFRTPYTRWTGRRSPGVEIIATCACNLMAGDWLRRLPVWVECALVVVLGVLLVLGFTLVRPMTATGLGLLAAIVVSGAGMVLVSARVWFPWLIVVAVQVPAAVGWAVLIYAARVTRKSERLEDQIAQAIGSEFVAHRRGEWRTREVVAGPPPLDTAAVSRQPMAQVEAETDGRSVPDHTLLRCIGKGAYGEVWLAADIIGTFHAVKLVFRNRFADAIPFEREFNGLRRFTPISRLHPGLVDILHVGRNTPSQYFYCIMELGDDELRGQEISPDNYSPRTLARELKRRQRLPLAECLLIGAELANALDFLHREKLIHRDIKPSNVIFVRGSPKFADVGLVTEVAAQDDGSYLGTQGYMAPEGPGLPTADIYGLGKLLYVSGFGMDCDLFPALPNTLLNQPNKEFLFAFNRLVLKACDPEPTQRFKSAVELEEALLRLSQQCGSLEG